MEASMKLALERTQRLLESTPNACLETFKKQVEDMQPARRNLAAWLRCERPPELLQIGMENTLSAQEELSETQSAIHRLQAEVEAWDALLAKHRCKAEALASQVERAEQSRVTLDQASLSRSTQWPLIQRKPDYCAVLARQQPALNTVQLMMDTQCQVVRGLLSTQECAQLHVKEASRRLAADAGIPDPSPDLVGKLISTLKVYSD